MIGEKDKGRGLLFDSDKHQKPSTSKGEKVKKYSVSGPRRPERNCEHRILDIIAQELPENPFIITKLIQMYADCDDVNYARHLFDELPQPNVFAWTALVSFFSGNGYVCNNFLALPMEMLGLMRLGGFQPDIVTFNTEI
nr:pentatricopeptide repeat-containing protein DOT4, chloroplastic-like [Ipomoea batatas]